MALVAACRAKPYRHAKSLATRPAAIYEMKRQVAVHATAAQDRLQVKRTGNPPSPRLRRAGRREKSKNTTKVWLDPLFPDRLRMGSWSQASNLLREVKSAKSKC
jgi:hypothetical protein